MAEVSQNAMVLIVDDEPDLLEIFSWKLETWGFPCVTAVTFAEALALVKTQHQKICAILSDYRLDEGKSGLDLKRQLPSELQQIPFIILTGQRSPELEAKCLANGVTALLEKPVADEVLEEILKNFKSNNTIERKT